MAKAFSDDPSIRYLLGGKSEGPDDWRYFYCILNAIYDKCIILSTDSSISSLLILFPPQLKSEPAIRFLLNGGFGLIRYFGFSHLFRSVNYEMNCEKIKKRFLTQQTWYCMCFVVDPKMQRRGIGSKLLRPVLGTLETYNTRLYLETHKTVNVAIYNKFGFKTVDISTIPDTGIKQYAMLFENCKQ